MKKILSVDGQQVLAIDSDLSPVQVGTDDGEFISITEYLETTLKSNIDYDYSELKHKWETAPLYMDARTKQILIEAIQYIREITNYSIAEVANMLGMSFREYHYLTKEGK